MSRAAVVRAWWLCRHQVWPGSSALSADERARADAMLRARDRAAYRRCRGALRGILASWTGAEAAALRFDYTATGRPVLPAWPSLDFSVSHTADWAVIVVGTAGPLGVDVEQINQHGTDIGALARRFLAPTGEPPPRSDADFARAWTRYEARVKAAGGSLGRPLPVEAATWPTIALDAPTGHAATLVCAGPALPEVRVRLPWHTCRSPVRSAGDPR
ncbi:phosphopantetheinyl transferase [Streptacidiphilus sp. MAP12-20]|uniref:4'-phosphopantetheinyl transferase family protein n=1 Tax=Streptacidiphilus sp. MAP12-20 TaxID=3156299 RepID=UPI003518D510